jgi:DNA-binding CsgD family transcriptional regulator
VDVSSAILRRAVTLVDALAALDDPARFADVALPGLAAMVGADVISYNEIGPTAGQVRYADHPTGALQPATHSAFVAYVAEHPVVNHYRATADGQALRISDFLSRAQFHRLGLYAEFFRHVPTEHQLAVALSTPDTTVIGIAFSRARSDFSEADRQLLSILRAPLMAGLLRARARHHAHHTLTTAADERLAQLTDREAHVLELVALGATNTAVAHALDVSPRTVAKHLEHIYRKLGVNNRAAAVALPPRSASPATFRHVRR